MQVKLWRHTRLVPLHLNGEDPSYFIVGGACAHPLARESLSQRCVSACCSLLPARPSLTVCHATDAAGCLRVERPACDECLKQSPE